MKIYIVLEKYYGELLQETGNCADIIGIYKDIEKAKNKTNEIIKNDIANDFVLDNNGEIIAKEEKNYRLFYGYQENWNCYYEIEIKEIELN